MNAAAPLSAVDSFQRIIDGLCEALGAPYPLPVPAYIKPAPAPVMLLVWTWLKRRAALVRAWAARVEAGTLPARRTPATEPAIARAPAADASPSDAAEAATVSAPKHRLPSGPGWLLLLSAWVPMRRSQLEHLLADPEMQALVQASPAVARALRPLCRALLIDLSLLPPLPARARAAKPKIAPVVESEGSAEQAEPAPLLPASSRKGRRRRVTVEQYGNGWRNRPPPLVPDKMRD